MILKANSTYLFQPEIIIYRGYPVELHTVLTEDGYLLGNVNVSCFVFTSCPLCVSATTSFRVNPYEQQHDNIRRFVHMSFIRRVFPFLFRHRYMMKSTKFTDKKKKTDKKAAVFPFKRVCPTFTFKQVNVMIYGKRNVFVGNDIHGIAGSSLFYTSYWVSIVKV